MIRYNHSTQTCMRLVTMAMSNNISEAVFLSKRNKISLHGTSIQSILCQWFAMVRLDTLSIPTDSIEPYFLFRMQKKRNFLILRLSNRHEWKILPAVSHSRCLIYCDRISYFLRVWKCEKLSHTIRLHRWSFLAAAFHHRDQSKVNQALNSFFFDD